MFTKWTKKEVLKFVLCFLAFFVLVLLTQLPGYASPFYWAIYSALAAFVAAGPITCVMNMKRGFLSAAAIPILWFIVYRCVGEIGMPLMWVWFAAVVIIAEVVYKLMGYDSLKSIRVCAPIASLAPMANIIPLYFQKSKFLAAALEEMDPTYVAGLDKYGTIGMFILVFVCAIVLAVISERITEKILKIET